MAIQEIEITVTGLTPPDARQVAAKFGWTATVGDDKGNQVANPESANDFWERYLERLTIEILRGAEQENAAQTARDTAGAAIDARIGGKKKQPGNGKDKTPKI